MEAAESCPFCGAKSVKMGISRKFFIGVFVLFVIGSITKESILQSTKISDVSKNSSSIAEDEKKKHDEEKAKQLSILLRISALREEMKNPPSFELVEVINLKNGTLCLTYRATNAFGGVVTESKAISSSAKIIDYAANCNGKNGEDVTHLKKYLKKYD